MSKPTKEQATAIAAVGKAAQAVVKKYERALAKHLSAGRYDPYSKETQRLFSVIDDLGFVLYCESERERVASMKTWLTASNKLNDLYEEKE